SLPHSIRCASGEASFTVHFAANSGTSRRTYKLSLQVSGKHGQRKAPTVAVRENGHGPSTFSTSTNGAAPQITANPTSETVAAGATASFTAAASGGPPPSVEWLLSTDGGATWSLILGASSSTYSFTATAAQSGDEFEAVFWNSSSAATSSPATLTIGTAPQVTTQPSSATVAAGNPGSFTAAASGTPAPSVQWQVSTDGGNTWGSIAGATSSTYLFTTSGQESGYEYRAVFTNAVGSATSGAAALTLTDQTSSNWSGYVATGGTFSAVSGAWTVPAVTCSSSDSYSADWVGIDGESSATVEQDGTESDCVSGSASYDAWYELYGDSSVNAGMEVKLGNYVSPGDSMTASVSVSEHLWTLTITDSTESWQVSKQFNWSAPAQSSAEWIAERPKVGSSLPPLANFATVAFTGAKATDASASGPIFDFTFAPVEMLASPGASPSQLDGTGESFTDTWFPSS
ncbi:MAG TPA: G1 family glutamic endopeptidase, partial [Solirubrobacteraceae bacterium]|nr:G1 family glutamic endopeptidase [Solirubrobacteraceae bacterium]